MASNPVNIALFLVFSIGFAILLIAQFFRGKSSQPQPQDRNTFIKDEIPPSPLPAGMTKTHMQYELEQGESVRVLVEGLPSQNQETSTPSPTATGAAQVGITIEMPEGAQVRITMERLPMDGLMPPDGAAVPGQPGELPATETYTTGERIPRPVVPSSRSWRVRWEPFQSAVLTNARAFKKKLVWPFRLETTLFAAALLVYLFVRLIGLADYPIYFFTDEAVQTVMAEKFIQNDLRNYDNELLPTYFNRDATYNLSSISVYLQVIPYLLFGKSVFITRAVSVVIATLGALAVGLILRDIFKLRYWWCGVLLLSLSPAWFLHSRTAFETVEMTSFYAGFLYFYLRYRYISPRALYPALVMGALVFYTYSPGQVIIVVTGLFLLFSDLRYHWQNRKLALKGLLLLAVLALPYLRYSINHPGALMQHLSTRAPYWAQDIPFLDKLSRYFTEYAYGLNPVYWFLPNQHDLDRHLMKGYGHLLLATFPFFLVGLVIIFTRLRSSAHRTVLMAMLAAPTGSALVGIGITRILVFVIPATLTTSLGLECTLGWLERGIRGLLKRWGVTQPSPGLFTGLSVILMVALAIANITMLHDALVNGPTWYQDYSLGGMQYGAAQLFQAVNDYIREHPSDELMISPSWTNGADAVAEFFLPHGAPVRMGSIEGHLYQHKPISDNMVFVMIPAEMDKVVESGKFTDLRIDMIVPYPNGAPGFYFVQLKYVDQIDEILAAEQDARSALLQTSVMLDGEPVQVSHSMLDMGTIELVFDGDQQTVARTLEANPFVIELTFPQSRQLNGYRLNIGSADVQVKALLYPASGGKVLESIAEYNGSVSSPLMDVYFDQSVIARKVRFEVFQPYTGVPANVHVWELELR